MGSMTWGNVLSAKGLGGSRPRGIYGPVARPSAFRSESVAITVHVRYASLHGPAVWDTLRTMLSDFQPGARLAGLFQDACRLSGRGIVISCCHVRPPSR